MTILSKFSRGRSRSTSPASVRAKTDSRKNPYSLTIVIESPPVVIYGAPEDSSGYLLSGLLYLDVAASSVSGTAYTASSPLSNAVSASASPRISASHAPSSSASSIEEFQRSSPARRPSGGLVLTPSSSNSANVTLKSVTLTLRQIVTYAKPFLPPSNTLMSCEQCREKVVELKTWHVVSAPASFSAGRVAFPFSHLLPGNLPPTCVIGSGSHFRVRYELVASALSNDMKKLNATVRMPIRVNRSVLKGPNRSSLRIFPPSNVTVTAQVPNVVHPKSEFTIEVKLDGLNDGIKRWRLRRLNWRLEENAQIKANACDLPYHQTKLKVVESSIRLNSEHKQAGSTFALGSQVRDLHEEADRDANEIDQMQEQDRFLHPEDHEAESEQRQQQQEQQKKKKELLNELFLQESRIIEKGAVKEGWKSDYSGTGVIEAAVDVNCRKLSTGLVNRISQMDSLTSSGAKIDPSLDIGTDANICCDINDPQLGIFVTHTLILEANLAEEVMQSAAGGSASLREIGAYKRRNSANLTPVTSLSPVNSSTSPALKPAVSTPSHLPTTHATVPTGVTRLFRMKFKIFMTERSGFGISWDEEVPPQYNHVSSFSPPSYGETAKMDDDFAELRI